MSLSHIHASNGRVLASRIINVDTERLSLQHDIAVTQSWLILARDIHGLFQNHDIVIGLYNILNREGCDCEFDFLVQISQNY